MNRRDWIAVAVAPLWAPAWAALVEVLRVRPDPILDGWALCRWPG